MTISELVDENKKRVDEMFRDFDPIIGTGAPLERDWLEIEDFDIPKQYVPLSMFKNKLIQRLIEYKTIKNFVTLYLEEEYNEDIHEEISRKLLKIRSKHDFCFWAYVFVKIKPKAGGDMIRFKLRNEQRYLLEQLELRRLLGVPIRIILLKARQWGGSTLVQIYIAWIQLLHKKGWYSTIIAQTLGTSRKIKAMYSKMLENYPSWMLDIDSGELELSPYEGSQSDFQVTYKTNGKNVVARDIVMTIGTYMNPDATRGGDTALIHFSEVGVWKTTEGKTPEDVVSSVCGGLLNAPLVVEVMESTAKGTGNFFHSEWVRAKRGESLRTPIFVAWYKIEIDTTPLTESQEDFAKWLIDNKDNDGCEGGWLDSGKYYWSLWEKGATFEGINWYRIQRKGYKDHADWASEAPSDDVEAFKHSGDKVFDAYKIDELRKRCKNPIAIGSVYSDKGFTGKECLQSVRFKEDKQGVLKIWSHPELEINVARRYVVSVDIGGEGKKSDFSVITVIDRLFMVDGGKPEVVARWRGHVHMDILAWMSAQIATYYCNALLIFEVNTYDKNKNKPSGVEADHSEFILSIIAGVYPNLYVRKSNEQDIREGIPSKWGYHVNRLTKPKLIDNLNVCLRELLWIERDEAMCDELAWYEKKADGSYGAIDGQHDDILMSTAIGLEVAINEMDMPKIIEETNNTNTKVRAGGAASF